MLLARFLCIFLIVYLLDCVSFFNCVWPFVYVRAFVCVDDVCYEHHYLNVYLGSRLC